MQRASLCRGFVLHSRAFRDSSLILETFLREHGRVALVARGVRGKRPAARARLQPFRELKLSFAGRGELRTLTDAEDAEQPFDLKGDALICGYYLNELLMRMLQHDDEHPDLYDSYRDTLAELVANTELDTPLRLFELHLLQGTGYGLDLDADIDGRALDTSTCYAFHDGEGFTPIDPDAQSALPMAHGRCLRALQTGEIPRACAGELRALLRAALRPHLGDQPLKSRELLSAIRSAANNRGE